MDISLSTMRTLGFEKIYNYYRIRGLRKGLERASYMTSGVKLPSYSFLSWYGYLSETEWFYDEYRQICLRSANLLDIDSVPTEAEKRKFRNSISYIFETLGKVQNELSELDLEALKDVCLAIPFVDRYVYDEKSRVKLKKIVKGSNIKKDDWESTIFIIREFFLAVLKWYCITSSESALEEVGYDVSMLVRQLVLYEDGFKLEDKG